MATTITIESVNTVDMSDYFPAIEPGRDWKWEYQVQDDNGNVEDTTGWDCSCTMRDKANGEEKIALTVGSGITHTPALGKFEFQVTDEQTETLDCLQVEFDLLITDDSGTKFTLLKATVPIEEVITT